MKIIEGFNTNKRDNIEKNRNRLKNNYKTARFQLNYLHYSKNEKTYL